jgi:5-oxoprolinase (ATP-hydrolysing)
MDVGGTFTDCIGRRPDGQLVRHKLLSSGVTKGAAAAGSDRTKIVDPVRRGDPAEYWTGYCLWLLDRHGAAVAEAGVVGFDRDRAALQLAAPLDVTPLPGQPYELVSDEEAPIQGIRYLLGLGREAIVPPVVVRLGTTRGTNALLTRTGARTALVTTRGFGDILRIGYQNRPRLFDLAIRKPDPLFSAVVEIDQRMAADGQVLKPPDPEAVRSQLAVLRHQGIESLAVCLLHAYMYPEHELLVGRLAEELGFPEISLSSRVAPLVKIVSRGDTTVVDAYLNPVLRAYIGRLRKSLGAGRLQLLTSAGGLVDADSFVGKDSILSGPAGGVIGFSRVAQAAGFERAIGFDMGGTSTDVSRFDGGYQREYETEKAGVRIVAPMMAIETVAAGGGSVCRFDGVKLVVGPESATADPGPACYGRGGPLAVTDMNLYQGKILAERFPFPLDREVVETRLQSLCHEIAGATGRRYTPHELADGFLRVANAKMVQAIRTISIAKGADPRQYVLVAFGGAAGQHACAVACELGIRQILCSPDAGVLSAYGIGMADVVRHRVAGVYQPYCDAALAGLETTFQRLASEACGEVMQEGFTEAQIDVHRLLDLRYRGFDSYLTIPQPAAGSYAEGYVAEHKKLYGYAHEGRALEIVAARVEAVARAGGQPTPSRRVAPRTAVAQESIETWIDGQPHRTGVFVRDAIRPGDALCGPAILCEATSTTVIDPGWEGEILSGGELLLTDRGAAIAVEVATESDPVMLEVFNNQFAGIAEQMGVTLRNTATSVNVKERLDFSCAVFTARGDLVVNAPHIPVHLGAMGETVRQILAQETAIRPGDVFVTNDPYRGGSHLPDVTAVTPVHDARTGQLLFFTASRAHHAEIGGKTPGSMPPFSTNLAEEGVVLGNLKVIEAGSPRFDRIEAALLSGPWPTRNLHDNLADITAQIAANRQGAQDLLRLVDRCSLDVVTAYMGHIQTAAEQKMQAALARLPEGRYHFADHLDDGSPIVVTITVAGAQQHSPRPLAGEGPGVRAAQATIDFTGTGPVLPGNLNANRAIVTAAVMYCLRCLIQEDIPLNQGVLTPIRVVLPECLLNPPRGETPEHCPAVVGGNVETSQRIVDVILGALGIAAASQGTMNNLLFGNAATGYYETICGGSGATAQADGADAVQCHMTNTRATDPEVLEQRYPVRLWEFSIRRGSGGAGQHRGGDGAIRRIEFLAELEVSLLTQRRGPYAPYGLDGGQPGALGRNILRRADGSTEVLPNAVCFTVRPGDTLTIETPGGGGFGALGSAPVVTNKSSG